MNIVFIGAGNLATHLALELSKHSFNIIQIYSRTARSAQQLATLVDSDYTTKLDQIDNTADIYIFSVKDSALSDLIHKIKPNNGLWLHTAGSIEMGIFENSAKNYGVIYPFQTFSKDRHICFKYIPIYIEANSENNLKILKKLCSSISESVTTLSSEKRKYLHLSGVFACNFVNHMYVIAEQILANQGLPFDSVLPLIEETTAKLKHLSPLESQTGPALRYDLNVINRHINLLDDLELQKVYEMLSKNIYKFKQNTI